MDEWNPSELMKSRKYLANKWAVISCVPTPLVLAVIQQESGGRAGAVRHEPRYMEKYNETPKFREIARVTGLSDEQIATSYGLMQLMLPLAWGYMSESDKGPGAVVALLNPEKNVRYGSSHLAVLLRQVCSRMKLKIDEDAVRSVAARYNGCKLHDDYADDVVALWRRYDAWLRGVK